MKKLALAGISAMALSFPAAAGAAPTAGPEAGPGCFGQWRAGSHKTGPTGHPGQDYFSQRKGENATINADNRATCAALSGP